MYIIFFFFKSSDVKNHRTAEVYLYLYTLNLRLEFIYLWLQDNSNPSSLTRLPSEGAKKPTPIRPISLTSGPLPFPGLQTDVG